LKQNEKSSLINEIHNVACQVDCQHDLLSKFHKIKLELDKAKEQIETCINQKKQRYTEITTKITVETKEGIFNCYFYFYLRCSAFYLVCR